MSMYLTFLQLCMLSLRSLTWLCCQIRVTFVNELGVEEAGVDGGGIFKDFMEGITKTGFDVQYGLFKVHHCTLSIGVFRQYSCREDLLHCFVL